MYQQLYLLKSFKQDLKKKIKKFKQGVNYNTRTKNYFTSKSIWKNLAAAIL